MDGGSESEEIAEELSVHTAWIDAHRLSTVFTFDGFGNLGKTWDRLPQSLVIGTNLLLFSTGNFVSTPDLLNLIAVERRTFAPIAGEAPEDDGDFDFPKSVLKNFTISIFREEVTAEHHIDQRLTFSAAQVKFFFRCFSE